MNECTKCIHHPVCKTAESCDGYVSGCEHFKEGWISVKDRLPDAMEWVLCATTYKTIHILRYDHIMDDWDTLGNANRCYVKTFVTHWMPLPQPPKGE